MLQVGDLSLLPIFPFIQPGIPPAVDSLLLSLHFRLQCNCALFVLLLILLLQPLGLLEAPSLGVPEHFHAPWPIRRASCCPGTSHCSREPQFLLLENSIRHPDLGVGLVALDPQLAEQGTGGNTEGHRPAGVCGHFVTEGRALSVTPGVTVAVTVARERDAELRFGRPRGHSVPSLADQPLSIPAVGSQSPSTGHPFIHLIVRCQCPCSGKRACLAFCPRLLRM